MNSTQVKIISAGWKHYALLAELGSSTFYETFAHENSAEDMRFYIDKTYSKEKVLENIRNPQVKYFVAYGENGDLGYVRKEALGSKTGSALMEQAISYARENGFQHLFLGVWQDNHRAIHFYEKYGFQTFNTRKFTLGKKICDDYLMALSL